MFHGENNSQGNGQLYESMHMLSPLELLAGKWLLRKELDFQNFLASKGEDWKWFMPHLTLGLKKLGHTFSGWVVPGTLMKKQPLLSSP